MNVPISFQDIRAISFDVGGTLLEPWPSVGQVYAEVAARCGVPHPDADALNRQFALAWMRKAHFDYSESAWFQLVRESFGASGSSLTPEFLTELYQRFGEPDVWKIYDDVLPTLDFLASEGIKLAAISNWDNRLRPLLQRLKLASYFEVIAVSGEIGFHKPSPVIFEQAVRQLGLPAQAVLHVGDSATEDVEGAQSAGLSALRVDRRGPIPDADGDGIRSLRELEKWFGPTTG